MASVPDNSFLSSDQDINQFLVKAEIELQISYTTIKNFTNSLTQIFLSLKTII